MKVTQRALAEKLGLSANAVSLALRNHPSISKATRERVQAMADQMGYRPNPLVAALTADRNKRGRSGVTTLAYLTTCHHLRSDVKNIRQLFYKGACERAEACGFSLQEFCLADPDLDESSLQRILLSRGIHGVLIAPPARPDVSIHMDWEYFAVAALGHNLAHPRVHHAAGAVYHNTFNMLNELKAMGYQRPALILKGRNELNQRFQHCAVFEYLSREIWGIAQPHVYLYDDASAECAKVDAWLDDVHPDVVISSDELFKSSVTRVLGEVPGAIGYVAIEGASEGRDARIDFVPETVGAVGVDLVTAQLYRNERGIPSVANVVQVESPFVRGASLRVLARDASAGVYSPVHFSSYGGGE